MRYLTGYLVDIVGDGMMGYLGFLAQAVFQL